MTTCLSHCDIQSEANSWFLHTMPSLRGYARRHLPHLPIHEREEVLAEAAARALISCHSLIRRGRSHLIATPGFVRYTFRSVCNGRHAAVSQAGLDVMSTLGRRRHHKRVLSLNQRVQALAAMKSNHSIVSPQYVADLIPDRRTPIPDQAAFRIDFSIWLEQFNHRDRRMIRLLASGEQARRVARILHLTPARVSQCRARWRKSWEQFVGEPPAKAA